MSLRIGAETFWQPKCAQRIREISWALSAEEGHRVTYGEVVRRAVELLDEKLSHELRLE